ncbi:MAG TPA: cobalt ECF transporter T component CbiQ [Phycisphaerae bacterium]|nr:cobalt ECF transporter T component CbiQ [Phycisphaerae bacterium]HNU44030.1 cobalt ECF transporter T component CbiQ [Phycisphaerae bacterium]
MHEKQLTRAAPPRTFLERLDARVKLLAALVWAVCVVTVPTGRGDFQIICAVTLLLLLGWNHPNLKRFARRFGTALPFILVLGVLLPFFRVGEPLWQWGWLQVTREGLATAWHVISSAGLCVAALCLVWATTSERDLQAGLRGLGVPAVLVGILGFMVRYLHVLRPELHRLWDAQAARTLSRRRGAALRAGAHLLGAFFLRAHDRAQRVADAMYARGYTGTGAVVARAPLRGADVAAGMMFLTGLLLARWGPWS